LYAIGINYEAKKDLLGMLLTNNGGLKFLLEG